MVRAFRTNLRTFSAFLHVLCGAKSGLNGKHYMLILQSGQIKKKTTPPKRWFDGDENANKNLERLYIYRFVNAQYYEILSFTRWTWRRCRHHLWRNETCCWASCDERFARFFSVLFPFILRSEWWFSLYSTMVDIIKFMNAYRKRQRKRTYTQKL